MSSTAEYPLISVIVPVYNVSDYLVECLESIASQSYPFLEVIVIDDGSTDRSGVIVDEYVNAHEGFIAIHKENGGLASARNSGVSLAAGEWVAFVDSDDVIAPFYIEALYKAAVEGGCAMSAVRYGFKFMDGDSFEFPNDKEEVFAFDVVSEIDYQRELLYQKSDNGSPYHLVRSDIAKSRLFPIGYIYEDLATTYNWVKSAGPVAVLKSQDLYAYRLRSGSILRGNFNDNKARSCRDVTAQLFSDITTWYPELTDAVHSRCFSVHRIVFAQVPKKTRVESELWEEIKTHRSVVLRDSSARSRERLAAAFACMGLRPYRVFCSAYPAIQHFLKQQ